MLTPKIFANINYILTDKKSVDMKLIKPKKLKKGNTIAFVGISGKIKEYERLEKAKELFEAEGYKVIISPQCKSFHRYMAGESDDDCVNSLHQYFLDDNIDAIICARGGYGTLRLINKINWDIIKKHPKIFAGYSDITVLLNMIFKKTGLITFHSPMPNGDFSYDVEEYTKNSFLNTLQGNIREYNAENFVCYSKGSASGRLWGGNLSSLVSLCGIDFIPNENLILFIEDLNEPVYKTDKMITQLFNIKKAEKNVKGIIIGEFKNIDNYELLDELFKETADKLNIPVCSGFKITHNSIKDTLPVGVNCNFNSENGTVHICENYVKL